MEKKLVARLNEIGQEIGYPYQVLKNGQYQVFDENANGGDVAVVVYGPIASSSRLVEMKKISEDDRKVWAELFPEKKEADDAVLTDDEQMKLIIFGKRRTVVNRFKKRVLSKRIARAMVARNDDKLLIEMANASKTLPCLLTSAIVKYTSDARFERIINLAKQNGISAFHETVENKLVKEGRENKFSVYVKAYGLTPSTQYILIHDKMISLLKVFVFNGGAFCNDIENALRFMDNFKEIRKIYQEAKKEYLAKQKAK